MSAPSTDSFMVQLTSLVEYYRKEHEITYAEIIGCLEIAKMDILTEEQDQRSE